MTLQSLILPHGNMHTAESIKQKFSKNVRGVLHTGESESNIFLVAGCSWLKEKSDKILWLLNPTIMDKQNESIKNGGGHQV